MTQLDIVCTANVHAPDLDDARARHGARLTARVRDLLTLYPALPPEPLPYDRRTQWTVRLTADAAEALADGPHGILAGRIRRAVAILADYDEREARMVAAREVAESKTEGVAHDQA